jgi:two-component system, OmpR family, alkaline phosphatase synthesis response regulator PhoP
MMPGTIVIIDHEPHIVNLLETNLNREGYQTLSAENGLKGLGLVRRELPTLVIMDLALPDRDGLSVLKHIRAYQQTRLVPIIILTARNEEADRVLGLEFGADDYMAKPFSPMELIARVKAVLRRCGKNKALNEEIPELIGSGAIQVDPQKHKAIIRGKEIELPPKEFDLLMLFLSNPGQVFTRDFILEFIWGYEYIDATRTVDVHVLRLRQKIEVNPAAPVFIETIRSVGYRFSQDC